MNLQDKLKGWRQYNKEDKEVSEHLKAIEEEEYRKTLEDTKAERLQKLEEEARQKGRNRAMNIASKPPLSKAFGVGLKRTMKDIKSFQNNLKGYGNMFPSAEVFSTSGLHPDKNNLTATSNINKAGVNPSFIKSSKPLNTGE